MVPNRFSRILLALLAALATAQAQSPPLTPVQEARLKQYLPRTFPKLVKREPITVIVCGDDHVTFAQPPGRPRYDSAMAWHGRFLEALGARFHFHGGIREPGPHSELRQLQKETEKVWRDYEAAAAAGKKVLPPDPAPFAPEDRDPLPLSDALRRAVPSWQQIPSGAEFVVENLGRDGACMVHAWQPLTTNALLESKEHRPDLVIISYGGQDALAGTSPAAYRTALEECVRLCRKQGVDVIVGAPPVTLHRDAREALGRVRQYAAICREVSETEKVLCADLGALMVQAPSDLQSLVPEECFDHVRNSLARDFQHGEAGEDVWHFNGPAHTRLGEAVLRTLLDGPPAGSPVEVTGILALNPDGTASVEYRLANHSDQSCSGVFCPLSLPGWDLIPGQKDFAFRMDARKARRVKWQYGPPAVSTNAFHPMNQPPAEPVLRGGAVLCDTEVQTLVNVPVTIHGVTIEWPEGRFDDASGTLLLACTLVNGSMAGATQIPVTSKAAVTWRDVPLPPVDITIPPGGRLPFPIRLPLPPAGAETRFRGTVTVSLPLPTGQILKFERTVDGIVQPALRQRIPLATLDEVAAGKPAGEGAPTLSFDADVENLFITCDLPAGMTGERIEGIPSSRIEVQVDGRDAKQNGTPGYVDRIVAEYPWGDGRPRFQRMRPGLFGNGYNYDFDPRHLRSRISTKQDGSRRIELTIPRLWLPHHEWSLDGSGQRTAGVNVVLSVADPAAGGFTPARTRALNYSGFALGDARGLALLELSPKPSGNWSLRVY